MTRIKAASNRYLAVLAVSFGLISGIFGASAATSNALASAPSPEARVAPGVYLMSASDANGGADEAAGERREMPTELLRALPRIVGGQETTIGQWPWQAAITANSVFPGNGFDRQICGGSLVASNLVITAAHCFFDTIESALDGFDDFDFDPSGLFGVITGRTQLSSGAGQETDVANYYWFVDGGGAPRYNPTTDEWDVVIVELATNSSSQTIKIAGPDEAALWEPGRAAHITGWGNTAEGGSSSDVLRQAEIEMISDSVCGSSSSYGSDFIPETMVCAGILAGGTDTCQGDSGGPLVVPTRAGGFRLVGDSSWGDGCARPNLPGVYGRLADDPMRSSLGDAIQSIAGVNVIGSGAKPPVTAADPPNTLTDLLIPRKVQTKGSTAKVTLGYACSTDESFGDNTCDFFECRLDGGDFKRCPGGASDPGPVPEEVTYRIKATRSWKTHVFAVRVTDTNGKTDPTPVKHRFQVRRKVPFLGIKRAKRAVIKRQRRADRAYCKNRSCSVRSHRGACKRRSKTKVSCRIVAKIRDRGETYTCRRPVTVRQLTNGKLKFRWGRPRCRRS